VHDLGYDVWYEPTALVIHAGGASAPRSTLLPTLAASRIRYARLHRSRPVAMLERLGIAFEALTHALMGRGGGLARVGWLRSLQTALTGRVPSVFTAGRS
jgi:hypothetical protein